MDPLPLLLLLVTPVTNQVYILQNAHQFNSSLYLTQCSSIKLKS